jgi:hypothetical protein
LEPEQLEQGGPTDRLARDDQQVQTDEKSADGVGAGSGRRRALVVFLQPRVQQGDAAAYATVGARMFSRAWGGRIIARSP